MVGEQHTLGPRSVCALEVPFTSLGPERWPGFAVPQRFADFPVCGSTGPRSLCTWGCRLSSWATISASWPSSPLLPKCNGPFPQM